MLKSEELKSTIFYLPKFQTLIIYQDSWRLIYNIKTFVLNSFY